MGKHRMTKTKAEAAIQAELSLLRRLPQESLHDFARRLYEHQLGIRSRREGRQVGLTWEQLDQRGRSGWLQSARRRDDQAHT